MNGGSGGAPQIFADQERAAAAPASRLITRPPDFEIFRHHLIVHTFFYFASLDLEKNLEIIAKFEMRNKMTQLHTVFYRAFNWLTNKK